MNLRHRVAAGFAVLCVLFLALVTLQLVAGDRLQARQSQRVAQIEWMLNADRAVLQYMTDAETGVRGFQLTGDKAYLTTYDSGRRGAFVELDRLAARSQSADIARLVEAERAAAERWLYAYGIPIVNAGVADADAARAARGKELFEELRTANAAVARAVSAEHEALVDEYLRATNRAQLLFAGLAVLVLVTGLVIAYLHQRHLLQPVEHIRHTLRQLADGERSARAEETGPAEMRAVIGTLNDLAGEIERLLTAEQARVSAGELRQSRLISELRVLDEQKDVFVSTVTHELRTPLTSILGYAEMLSDGDSGELTPMQERSLGAILRNAHRLQATVADLLLLDRDNERIGAEPVPVDLAAMLTGVHDELAAAARAKNVDSDLEVGEVWVRGDGVRLERALRKLVDNAIKFTPSGGRFVLRLTAHGPDAVVTVTDTGMGIPADDLPGLFTPFHRAANAMSQAAQGPGLGLAIVRNIVTEHGGTVAVRSELGRGSTFTVVLPALVAAEVSS